MGRKFESAVAELGVAERSARAAIAADEELEDDALLVACQRDDRAPALGGDAGAEPALDALLTLDFDQRADDRDGMLDRDTLDRHRKALSVLLRRAESAGPVSATRPLTETVAQYVPALRLPMVAALSNLPLHARGCGVSYLLDSVAPGYRRAVSAANAHASALGQPMIQPAVTAEHVEIAVEQEPRRWAKAALIVMWVTSSWPGCVLQLRAGNVSFHADSGRLTATFVEGKAVIARGGAPYTTSCVVPSAWRPVLAEYLYQRCARHRALPDDPLFPSTAETCERLRTARLQDALRVAHPALNLRGLRRGSLEAFLASGATPEELCARAGHRCVQATQRFLADGHRSREMVKTLPLASALYEVRRATRAAPERQLPF